VGVRLAGDLAHSGSNPDAEVFQVEMRQPVYDCCAADRDQGLLHRVRHGLVGAASCEKEQRRDTFFQLAANHLQLKACERIAQAFKPNELCEIPVAQNIQYTRYHRGYLLAY
jgi:hypothetical protein